MLIGVFQLLQAKRDEIETGRRYVEGAHGLLGRPHRARSAPSAASSPLD